MALSGAAGLCGRLWSQDVSRLLLVSGSGSRSHATAVTEGAGSSIIFGLAKAYPRTVGILIAGTKAFVADLIVQKGVERRKEVDWRRSCVFLGFGGAYMGGAQYIFYVDVLGRAFPRAATFAAKSLKEKLRDRQGQLAVVGQACAEQFFHTPVFFFPAFYLTKEAFLGDPAKRERKSIVRAAFENYRTNFLQDMCADMIVWFPAHFINFTFMPMFGRIPFVACVSFSYTMILSFMRGAPSKSDAMLAAEQKLIPKNLQARAALGSPTANESTVSLGKNLS